MTGAQQARDQTFDGLDQKCAAARASTSQTDWLSHHGDLASVVALRWWTATGHKRSNLSLKSEPTLSWSQVSSLAVASLKRPTSSASFAACRLKLSAAAALSSTNEAFCCVT